MAYRSSPFLAARSAKEVTPPELTLSRAAGRSTMRVVQMVYPHPAIEKGGATAAGRDGRAVGLV
jgi:hypothetical protein